MPAPENTPCPSCGHIGLTLKTTLLPKPLGTYSLAGAQMKLSAIETLIWSCPACPATGPAEVANGEAADT